MGKTKKVKGTKQTLEYVEQPEKLHVKTIKCKNARQKEFLKTIEDREVTICNGLAGSGKTYVALYYALKALEKGKYDKIVLVKSVTTLDQEDVGFLPGDIAQKMDPFMYSYYGNIDKIIGEEWRKRLVKEGKIQIQPLAYIRGINIDNAVCIIDECQNLYLDAFKSIITRIGENSKYIILGDCQQIDRRHKKSSILEKILGLFKDSDYVGTVEFQPEDCVRNPIIPKILDKLKLVEQQGTAIPT